MKMKKLTQGFTLVEIMIVVAIIGILAAIAIPNFVKSRKRSQQNACIANLKQLQGAKEQCLLDTNDVAATDMFGASGYIKVQPVCPADGTKTFASSYTLGTADVDPVCQKMPNDTDYPHKLPTVVAAGT